MLAGANGVESYRIVPITASVNFMQTTDVGGQSYTIAETHDHSGIRAEQCGSGKSFQGWSRLSHFVGWIQHHKIIRCLVTRLDGIFVHPVQYIGAKDTTDVAVIREFQILLYHPTLTSIAFDKVGPRRAATEGFDAKAAGTSV